MPSSRTFYRSVYYVEVVSEHPLPELDLNDLDYETRYGDSSGQLLSQVRNEPIDAVKAAKTLLQHGKDPDYFGLDEQGNDLESDDVS